MLLSLRRFSVPDSQRWGSRCSNPPRDDGIVFRAFRFDGDPFSFGGNHFRQSTCNTKCRPQSGERFWRNLNARLRKPAHTLSAEALLADFDKGATIAIGAIYDERAVAFSGRDRFDHMFIGVGHMLGESAIGLGEVDIKSQYMLILWRLPSSVNNKNPKCSN